MRHSSQVNASCIKYFLGIAILLSMSTLFLSVVATYDTSKDTELPESRAALVIRKIGHSLLLQVGDSSSRVLPIKPVDKATFELTFETSFSFVPDSLVSIVRSQLAEHHLPADYVVQVVESSSQDVVYGFAIGADQANVIPCTGRVQPRGHYTVQIAFTNSNASKRATESYFLFFLALASLGSIAFVGKAWVRRQKPGQGFEQPAVLVGSYRFEEKQGILSNDTETITLSAKETKLLRIFAAEPNSLIERNRLLKEVWEDEGVFTGRSLDMFISKLRKKLKNDASLRLTNVRGKGYTLETDI